MAKNLTMHERGEVRRLYSRRKLFWDTVEVLMRRGLTSSAAIDRIYQVYGVRSSVTTILQKLRLDKKQGGHEQLR